MMNKIERDETFDDYHPWSEGMRLTLAVRGHSHQAKIGLQNTSIWSEIVE
jgi:hypothetical protein